MGKTTCAAALGVTAAASGQRVLVMSTDPASSLANLFQLPRLRPRDADRPRAVRVPRGRLHVVEIDGPRALERWLAGRRETLERIALRGTWLDEEDVSRLLRLSLPGIDEIAALFEIVRAGRTGAYDLVVVDTAPTGHTLRMLATPETLLALARVFDHMQDKHRLLVATLRGGWTPDAEEALIGELARDGEELAALLRDPVRMHLDWVSLPEPMSVEETADAAARLGEAGIPLQGLVVNRVTPEPSGACARCEARRAFEQGAIGVLRDRIPGVPVATVSERDREPRDVRSLRGIGRELGDTTRVSAPSPRARPRSWHAALDGSPVRPSSAIVGRASLVLFGGKGGTGKTTCASAAAIHAALARPRQRVLLLSVDPAHSLSDVLGATVGDTVRALPGGPPNLFVRELDAPRQFALVRARYAAAIEALFDRLSRGASAIDATSDRIVMHDLIDLAPPGIDELVAVIDVLDALDDVRGGGYHVIVVDTAPTGHALRLLETPALVQEWVRALMSILLKYQAVVGMGPLGEILLKLSQGLGRMRERLTDRARTRFIAVTRPAALPRAETARLVARLRAMQIDVPAVIVNAAGRGTCVRCRAGSAAEHREIEALSRAIVQDPGRMSIVIAPEYVPPPQGRTRLREWARAWCVAAPAISS